MFKFGAIVLVPFPFTDLTSTKVRPALILSDAEAGAKDIIVAFVTSRGSEADAKGHWTLKTNEKYFKETGLKVDSTIRFDKLATLSKGIVLGELGLLKKEVLKKAKPKFLQVFGF
ncbi:MAG: type II toxin-antitoxin system PemK/MazF family toxin [Candidatus Gracilibacteria bacterium]|jgi:mRNA interferase MazF